MEVAAFWKNARPGEMAQLGKCLQFRRTWVPSSRGYGNKGRGKLISGD